MCLANLYLCINTKISVDYIVEQGVSGIWIYRKWASGIAECWTDGVKKATGSTPTAIMGGYYSYATIDLPFTFSSFSSISGNGQLSTGLGFFCGTFSSTSTINVFILGNANSNDIGYSAHVKGWW